jgi:hypothetical protein
MAVGYPGVKPPGQTTTRTTAGQRLVATLVVVVLMAVACGTRSAGPKATGKVSAVDVAGFAAQFDAGVGHRRLVLLMSPT